MLACACSCAAVDRRVSPGLIPTVQRPLRCCRWLREFDLLQRGVVDRATVDLDPEDQVLKNRLKEETVNFSFDGATLPQALEEAGPANLGISLPPRG